MHQQKINGINLWNTTRQLANFGEIKQFSEGFEQYAKFQKTSFFKPNHQKAKQTHSQIFGFGKTTAEKMQNVQGGSNKALDTMLTIYGFNRE